MQRYRIQFPPQEATTLDQDEVFFYLMEQGERTKLRFHDYDKIYERPGLYEQVFYERLKCNSPKVVTDVLRRTVEANRRNFSELRVLDLGAGNGIMGEMLKQHGVARLIGADIIPEARSAAYRDRPELYDDYYVADFTQLSNEEKEELQDWSFNCLTCVAALGFGDIPPAAFFQALQFVRDGGWVAFNIKETFLKHTDQTGFSRLIRQLMFSQYMTLHHIERYRHRLSMEGRPLFYFTVVMQKAEGIPDDFLQRFEIADQ